ncbi:protein FAM32A isoform X1 [Pseudophryne corroboree]|uniref:protein FAM32A isoform X1 n=1 Tax=Pseudophryne corroboree TaxID=495146 RepID=UPI003081276E
MGRIVFSVLVILERVVSVPPRSTFCPAQQHHLPHSLRYFISGSIYRLPDQNSCVPWLVRTTGYTNLRKKKAKDKNKMQQMLSNTKNEEKKKPSLDKRTPAQLAFEKMQEKRQMERILQKASKTHKQRVEDFNRHLDALTEHYDIPKVSWTK